MNPSNRRVFMMRVVAGGAVLAGTSSIHAQAPEKLAETDPYAKSMGFRLDTTKVDKARYPRHDDSQKCSKCQLWDGKPGAEFAACSFFGDRHTPSNGWCKNFKVIKA
jgi:High potential iron-sulfur protein